MTKLELVWTETFVAYLKVATRNLRQDRRCPDRDSKWAPPKYKLFDLSVVSPPI
jgi:hypothetical protein